MTATALLVPGLSAGLAGCSFLGIGGGDDGSGVSVFDAEPGQCFESPTEVKAQISKITKVDCAKPHGQELYAKAEYETDSKDYPGDDAIAKFAEGACAEAYQPYVGVSYLDSSLFYTYLAPSARSWQDADRTVLCFVTDAGAPMTGSVKGSKK
jgi:hypothetical protein